MARAPAAGGLYRCRAGATRSPRPRRKRWDDTEGNRGRSRCRRVSLHARDRCRTLAGAVELARSCRWRGRSHSRMLSEEGHSSGGPEGGSRTDQRRHRRELVCTIISRRELGFLCPRRHRVTPRGLGSASPPSRPDGTDAMRRSKATKVQEGSHEQPAGRERTLDRHDRR